MTIPDFYGFEYFVLASFDIITLDGSAPPPSEDALFVRGASPRCVSCLFLSRLPPEILLKILSHLDAASLLSLSHVNKLFRGLANDEWATFSRVAQCASRAPL